MKPSSFNKRFYEACRIRAVDEWNILLRDLEAELQNRPVHNLTEQAFAWAELKTLQALTERLAEPRLSDFPAILAARDNATQILKLLAENESRGHSRMTYNDLQTALEMKKANLSMQLGYLEKNDILRRQRQGRTTWIELSPSARKYAQAQGWLVAQEILTPSKDTFAKSNIAQPMQRPRAAWSTPTQK